MHEKWRQMRVEVEGRRERQTLMRDGRQGEERERLERKPNHVCPSGSRMNAAAGSWYIGTCQKG